MRGRQHVDAASLSDPVLVRADGTYLYTLPSVVDDIDLGITHVIRGEDHVVNTAPQIQLFEALGATTPAFGHHSLLVSADGHALSKRDRSISIQGMREEGIEALAVASYVSTIGTSDPIVPHANIDELVRASTSRSCRARRRDSMPTSSARSMPSCCTCCPTRPSRIGSKAMGVGGGEAFWNAVRGNLAVLGDADAWWGVVQGPLEPVIESRSLCHIAAGLLPPEPWDDGDVVRLVRGGERGDGREGQGAVRAVAACAHGPRAWARAEIASAADWAGARGGAARRQSRVSGESAIAAAVAPPACCSSW